MIKAKRDIRKIKSVLLASNPAAKSGRSGFGIPVRLIQFLEKNRMVRGIVNKHFHNYNMLSPARIKKFFSSAASREQLSRVYENFYQKKLETERHYYRSKPTMTYKMLKTFFDYDYRKEAELVYRKAPPAPSVRRLPENYEIRERVRDIQAFNSVGAAALSAEDLAMITENVLSALARQRLREERRKGR